MIEAELEKKTEEVNELLSLSTADGDDDKKDQSEGSPLNLSADGRKSTGGGGGGGSGRSSVSAAGAAGGGSDVIRDRRSSVASSASRVRTCFVALSH